MVAVGLAYLIARRTDQTIYRSQLRNREEAQSARLRLGLPLLGRVQVAEAMSVPRLVLAASVPVSEAVDTLSRAGVPGAPVVDAEGRFRGTVELADLAADGDDIPVSRRVDAAAPSVAVDANLDEAIDALPEGHPWLTVLDGDRSVRGILAISDIVRAYHLALRADERRISQVSANAGIADLAVGEDSALVGRTLVDAELPEGAIVVSVRRADSVLLGLGTVQLRAGDVVTVLARPARMAALRALLNPDESRGAPGR
jgi:CBS domain-containing protein